MAAAVEILVGAARRGKTPRLLREYRSALQTSARNGTWGKTLWLAPTGRARKNVLSRLLDDTLPVCFAPNVMTFDAFAEKILKWCPQDVTAISDVARTALLRTLVADLLHEKQLKYFAPIAETAGFLRLVSEFIRELKRDEIWPIDFAKAVRKRGESPKDSELLLIYERYQAQLLEMKLYDTEGRFWSARTELSQNELGPFQNLSIVIVDGFTDFTKTQYEILDKLAELVDRMLISLPVESPLVRTDLFAKSDAALQRLKEISPNVVVRAEHERTERDGDLSAFVHIADELFANPRNIVRASDARGIGIIATAGQLGEVEALAERVKRLLMNGVRPDEIVVTFRAMDEYAELVNEVFASCGIPHVCESKTPLSQIPVIKAVCSLIQLEVEGWPFERLMSVLGSSYFRPAWSNGDLDSARRAVAQSLRALRIHADRETMLRALEREVRRRELQKEVRAEDERSANDTATRKNELNFAAAFDLLQQVSQAFEPWRKKQLLGGWIKSIASVAEDLSFVPATRATADAGEASDAENRDRAAWEFFLRSLGEVEDIEGRTGRKARKRTLEEFQDLLNEIILPEPLPGKMEDRGRVRILDAAQVRGLDVPHLFLAGLSEGAFPRVRNDDCLYNESERRSLNECGLSLGHRSSRSQDEMLLFYGVVTRAVKSLVLSYPSISTKGQPLFPSPYLAALRDLFDEDALTVTTIEQLHPIPSTDRILSSTDMRLVSTNELAHDRPSLFRAMAAAAEYTAVARNILAAVEMAELRFHAQGFTAFEGLLALERHVKQLATRFPADYQFSATQLEAYASCPFRFFLTDVLHVDPLDSPRAGTDFLTRGNLLHGVLARLHGELSETGSGGEEHDVAEGTLTERFKELVSEHLGRRVHATELQQVLAGIEEQLLHEWAAAYEGQSNAYRDEFGKDWDTSPRPALFEIPFGNAPDQEGETRAGAFDSLTIGKGRRAVRVRGRIDRIDIGRIDEKPVFNIIDYKSGMPPRFSLDDVRAGLSLQLALYTLAAARMNLAGKGAVPFQMGYWSIRETGFVSGLKGKSKPLDDAAMKALEQLLEEVVPSLAEGMRSGAFPVDSRVADCTGRCPYNTVCRVNQIRPLAEKLNKRRTID